MAKLYFKYGTVSSSKTLDLLVTAHNYEMQGKEVLVCKPKIDTRFGVDTVKTRIGLERRADLLLEDNFLDEEEAGIPLVDCILVDEAQFLSETIIDKLRWYVTAFDVPIICYGLRADFRGYLFEGTQRLFEVADKIEEIKTICHYCNNKATMNIKLIEGKPTLDGPSIELGAEEKYLPTCYNCWYLRTSQ